MKQINAKVCPLMTHFVTCQLSQANQFLEVAFMASTNDIVEILSATLNPDTNARVSAEIKLAELLANPSMLVHS